MGKLVSALEMGDALGGLHPCTVLRWAEQGHIPSIKVGKYRRFEPDEVLKSFKDGSFKLSRQSAGGCP